MKEEKLLVSGGWNCGEYWRCPGIYFKGRNLKTLISIAQDKS